MVDILLKQFRIFYRIQSHISLLHRFIEGLKIRILPSSYLVFAYELCNVIIAVLHLGAPIDRLSLLIRLEIHSCDEIVIISFLFEGDSETDAVSMDELQLIAPHGIQEVFEPSGKIMSRIPIDGRRVQIDQKIFHAELLHPRDSFFRIGSIEVLIEVRDKTIVVIPVPVVGYEIGEECPDPVDRLGIAILFGWIQYFLVDAVQDILRIVSHRHLLRSAQFQDTQVEIGKLP